MTALVTRADAIAALLLSPFIGACLLLIACAIWLAAHLDRQPRIGRTSAETEARRVEFRGRAFGGRR